MMLDLVNVEEIALAHRDSIQSSGSLFANHSLICGRS
jgi:hypothetical protein